MVGLELVLGLALLAGLLYWMRGFWPPIARAGRRGRDLWRTYRRLAARSSRPAGAPRRRVVDVTARRGPAPGGGSRCPACGDALSAAQVDALRSRSIRCPGSARVNRPCPYRDPAGLS